jgi:hypothetical protein
MKKQPRHSGLITVGTSLEADVNPPRAFATRTSPAILLCQGDLAVPHQSINYSLFVKEYRLSTRFGDGSERPGTRRLGINNYAGELMFFRDFDWSKDPRSVNHIVGIVTLTVNLTLILTVTLTVTQPRLPSREIGVPEV